MTQYISKSALVAEIERRMQELRPINTHKMQVGEKMDRDLLMWLNALTWVKKVIDTLEVGENDLVEEIDYDDYMAFFKEHPDYNDGSWGFEETWTFAQYCYTLGLKAQKGE